MTGTEHLMQQANRGWPVGKNTQDYVNPFYGIARKHIPLNVNQMFLWADLFAKRIDFFAPAMRRVAAYFNTNLTVTCDNAEHKAKYEQALDDMDWRGKIQDGGENLLIFGNWFFTCASGFDRAFKCATPKCGKVTMARHIDDYKFSLKEGVQFKCAQCGKPNWHKIIDSQVKDPKRMIYKVIDPREIHVLREDTTGVRRYFWAPSASYRKRVEKDEAHFYSKETPKTLIDAMAKGKDYAVEFNRDVFCHLEVPTPVTMNNEGKAVPPCIFLFDAFFEYQVLKRFNEAICYEDIVPFRILSMTGPGDGASHPLLQQNGAQWRMEMQRIVHNHRRDPGSYHILPYPVSYQNAGGSAKQLAPMDLLKYNSEKVLGVLNVPQELFYMSLNTTAAQPALRLFENSWSFLPHAYDMALQKMVDVLQKANGWSPAKVAMLRPTLVDDINKQQTLVSLMSGNLVSKTTAMKSFNLDYAQERETALNEQLVDQEIQEKIQRARQAKESERGGAFGGQGGDATASPTDLLGQAQEIARQLYPMDGPSRREQLQQIKSANQQLWSLVKTQLEQLTGANGPANSPNRQQ